MRAVIENIYGAILLTVMICAPAGLPPVTLPIAEFVLMNGMVFGGILLIVADPLVALLMTVALACVFRALEPLIERLEKNAPSMGDEV